MEGPSSLQHDLDDTPHVHSVPNSSESSLSLLQTEARELQISLIPQCLPLLEKNYDHNLSLVRSEVSVIVRSVTSD